MGPEAAAEGRELTKDRRERTSTRGVRTGAECAARSGDSRRLRCYGLIDFRRNVWFSH